MSLCAPPHKLLTLIFVRQNGRILLGLKKRGFGAGRWNGFGGKVEPGETVFEGACRELKEEACITSNLQEVGRLYFEFVNNPQIWEVHVFCGSECNPDPQETEEMKPQWYEEKDIPFERMWEDDRMWFPYLLRGEYFTAYALFEGETKMISASHASGNVPLQQLLDAATPV
eukprot:m.72981 g.72981  ORF g.72981 m.72981 type:complete len:171 (+) comp17003_c1_seq1:101-613(+)